MWYGIEKESIAEGAYEKYVLVESDGSTTLTVSVDVDDQYEAHMDEGFSKGLEEVKQIAEHNTA